MRYLKRKINQAMKYLALALVIIFSSCSLIHDDFKIRQEVVIYNDSLYEVRTEASRYCEDVRPPYCTVLFSLASCTLEQLDSTKITEGLKAAQAIERMKQADSVSKSTFIYEHGKTYLTGDSYGGGAIITPLEESMSSGYLLYDPYNAWTIADGAFWSIRQWPGQFTPLKNFPPTESPKYKWSLILFDPTKNTWN